MTRRRKVKRGDEIVEMPTFDIMVERLVATATSGSVREAAAALRLIDKHLSHLLQPPPQQTMIIYHRAPGSQVILPPAELWKTRS